MRFVSDAFLEIQTLRQAVSLAVTNGLLDPLLSPEAGALHIFDDGFISAAAQLEDMCASVSSSTRIANEH